MFPEAFIDRIFCAFPYVNLHYRDDNIFYLLCLARTWLGKETILGQLNRELMGWMSKKIAISYYLLHSRFSFYKVYA